MLQRKGGRFFFSVKGDQIAVSRPIPSIVVIHKRSCGICLRLLAFRRAENAEKKMLRLPSVDGIAVRVTLQRSPRQPVTGC